MGGRDISGCRGQEGDGMSGPYWLRNCIFRTCMGKKISTRELKVVSCLPLITRASKIVGNKAGLALAEGKGVSVKQQSRHFDNNDLYLGRDFQRLALRNKTH